MAGGLPSLLRPPDRPGRTGGGQRPAPGRRAHVRRALPPRPGGARSPGSQRGGPSGVLPSDPDPGGRRRRGARRGVHLPILVDARGAEAVGPLPSPARRRRTRARAAARGRDVSGEPRAGRGRGPAGGRDAAEGGAVLLRLQQPLLLPRQRPHRARAGARACRGGVQTRLLPAHGRRPRSQLPPLQVPLRGRAALRRGLRPTAQPRPVRRQQEGLLRLLLRAREGTGCRVPRRGVPRPLARGGDIGQEETLAEVAERAGLARAEFLAALREPHYEAALERSNADARADEVFGFPFFIYEGKRFWGNDRIEWLVREIKKG